MYISPQVLSSVLALVAGLLIFVRPRLLNYVVATYLVVIGVLGLWPHI